MTKEVAEASEAAKNGLKDLTSTGTSVLVEGQLSKTPPGTKQVRAEHPRICLVISVQFCEGSRP